MCLDWIWNFFVIYFLFFNKILELRMSVGCAVVLLAATRGCYLAILLIQWNSRLGLFSHKIKIQIRLHACITIKMFLCNFNALLAPRRLWLLGLCCTYQRDHATLNSAVFHDELLTDSLGRRSTAVSSQFIVAVNVLWIVCKKLHLCW